MQFTGDRHDPLFKDVSDERLEQWIQFMEIDLYAFLVDSFKKRRLSWISILVDPKNLNSAQKELGGVGIDYFQGAYMEDGCFEDFFGRMKNEYNVRCQSRARGGLGGDRSPRNGGQPVDLAREAGLRNPSQDPNRSRFGYRNP